MDEMKQIQIEIFDGLHIPFRYLPHRAILVPSFFTDITMLVF